VRVNVGLNYSLLSSFITFTAYVKNKGKLTCADLITRIAQTYTLLQSNVNRNKSVKKMKQIQRHQIQTQLIIQHNHAVQLLLRE
jgi:CBS-domain-containing membrane protein